MLKPKKKAGEKQGKFKKSEEKLLYIIEVTCGNASMIRHVKCCTVDRDSVRRKVHYVDLGLDFMRNLDYIDIIIFKEFDTHMYTYTKEGEEVYSTKDIDTYETVRFQILKQDIENVLNPTYLTDGGLVEVLNYFLRSWTKWDTRNVYIYDYTREDFERTNKLSPTSCLTKDNFLAQTNTITKVLLKLIIKSHIKELVGVLEYQEEDEETDKKIIALILLKVGAKGKAIEEFSIIPLKVNKDSFNEFQHINKR